MASVFRTTFLHMLKLRGLICQTIVQSRAACGRCMTPWPGPRLWRVQRPTGGLAQLLRFEPNAHRTVTSSATSRASSEMSNVG